MKNLQTFEDFINENYTHLNEEKWSKDVKIEKGKMHKILDIPEDKKIIDVYKDPKKLAKDLLDKTSKKEAAGMLAYAANINPKENIFDEALKELKNIQESGMIDNQLYEEDSYNDYPESARNDAKKAIEWREKYPDQVKAGTAVGWTRAHQLAKGEKLSIDTIKRMKAFFDRHQGNEKVNPDYKDEPWRDNGLVSWKIWGGDSAYEWAKKKLKEIENNE
jgi:hypothetical protein